MSETWIFVVECDFCAAKTDIQHVEFKNNPMHHHYACWYCIEKRGWNA